MIYRFENIAVHKYFFPLCIYVRFLVTNGIFKRSHFIKVVAIYKLVPESILGRKKNVKGRLTKLGI